MAGTQSKPVGPDLALGIPAADLADGRMLAGHVGDEAVLLARSGSEGFAIGATCTHYGGPQADGLMVGDTVRCPWHHACFSLRTGEALRSPAFAPVPCWVVEQRDGRIFVRAKAEVAAATKRKSAPPATGSPKRIVIVRGGAAGFAAAEMLRREGYVGSIVMLSSEDAPPVDRPNPERAAPPEQARLRALLLLGHRPVRGASASPAGVRGRDGCCQPPPAQIRTCPIPAYGSYLEFLTAKRLRLHGPDSRCRCGFLEPSRPAPPHAHG
jgi:nitrite reductase/ring-hydroxylating ferredoxin subunit